MQPAYVAKPATADEVAALLKAASGGRVPVTAQEFAAGRFGAGAGPPAVACVGHGLRRLRGRRARGRAAPGAVALRRGDGGDAGGCCCL